MDTISTTTLSIFGAEIGGLLISAFTPIHFIILVGVLGITIVILKFGDKLFSSRRRVDCNTCTTMVRTTSDIFNKKIRNVEESIIKEQMVHANLVISTIESKIVDAYKSKMDMVNLPPIAIRDELKMYRAFIQVQSETASDWIRYRLIENHILDKNMDEFDVYMEEVVDKLISDTRNRMIDNWSVFFSVKVTDNKDAIDALVPELRADIKSIFVKARNIAETKHKELVKLEREYNREFESIQAKARRGEL